MERLIDRALAVPDTFAVRDLPGRTYQFWVKIVINVVQETPKELMDASRIPYMSMAIANLENTPGKLPF